MTFAAWEPLSVAPARAPPADPLRPARPAAEPRRGAGRAGGQRRRPDGAARPSGDRLDARAWAPPTAARSPLLLAALAPERVRSLVAVTVADHADETMRRGNGELARLLAAATDAESRGRFHERLVEEVYSDGFRQRFGERAGGARGRRSRRCPTLVAATSRRLRRRRAARPAPPPRRHSLPDPGRRRRRRPGDAPPSARWPLAAAIAGAETRMHETSGHALVAEDPRLAGRVALDFSAGTARTPSLPPRQPVPRHDRSP